jgi:hypothetical protein
MATSDFNTAILVNQTPDEVFNAVTNVRGWWSENLEGSSQKLNDEFTVSFGETWITHKIVELEPGKKIVWLVTDCNKHWLKDKKEWKGTKMNWDISTTNGETQITFTHIGLINGLECYNGCEKAWNFYINESLFKLLTEGKGQPEKKMK